ncbi:MAG: molybdopterin-dependent oxidoreductase [Myxococcota bacterium]
MTTPAPAATRTLPPAVSKTPLPLDARNLATVCVLCSHNCGLRVDVKDGRIAAVRGDDSSPITHGYLCNKAFAIPHYAHHEQRLQHPLRRTPEGGFERISWEQATHEIGEKLAGIRREHGPRAIGLVGIGGQANHMDAPFAISWLRAVGSKRWFNAFAQEKHQHFLIDQWMFDLPPTVWFHPDQANAKLLLVMGSNPRISNRGHNANETFKAFAEDPARRLLVVDPRQTETTRQADRHIRALPGTDAWFLLGVAASIISSEGLVDAAFVTEHTRGFEALRSALAAVDVEAMARRCGLAPDEIRSVAQELATAESGAIMFDLAVEQTLFSTLISYLIRVLSIVTGNVGRPGGNIFPETAAPPQRSPGRFEEPERTLASGIRSIEALTNFGMFSPTLVPEEVLLDHPERLRALVVEGANPLLSYSDTSRWREACDALDLLVVIEPAMTETAELADYVLPTPCGYEKWEQALFPKGYPEIHVQLRPPVIPGPEEALPEPEIYTRLAEAMGLIEEPPARLHELAREALEPAGAMAYLAELQAAAQGDEARVMFWGYRTLGPQLPSPALVSVWAACHQNAMLRPEGVLRTLGDAWKDRNPFEIAAELFHRILDHPEGVEIARADLEDPLASNIRHEDGKIRLAPAPMLDEIARAVESEPPTDPERPFVLAAGIRTPWTANTIQRDPAWRKGRGPHCTLHLAPADAEGLGIAEGEPVRVSTRRGSVELPATLDGKCRTGHVWIPNGFGMSYPGPDGRPQVQGVNMNELTDVADRDPISGCPHHKYTLCRIERVCGPQTTPDRDTSASARGARSEAKPSVAVVPAGSARRRTHIFQAPRVFLMPAIPPR